MQLALLGGGNMGEALLAGLLESGWEPAALAVAEVDADRRRALEARFAGVRVVPSPAWAVAEADVVVVAVKPAQVTEVLAEAHEHLAERALILSIAAGVPTATIEGAAPGHPVVRAMPNTPALVGRGAAAIAGGRDATDLDLVLAERVLGAVGVVVRVPEESIDAVTGLSGSGPAYVFLLAEALIDAGVAVGLSRETAAVLVAQTVHGAGAMLTDAAAPPDVLRARVTSPGGTTEAGVARLEHHDLRGAIADAVVAATKRSVELGAAR